MLNLKYKYTYSKLFIIHHLQLKRQFLLILIIYNIWLISFNRIDSINK